MSPFTCSRERELSELLQNGFWPQACSDDLRAHVASCRSCSDLVLVTEALQGSRRQSADLARLQPSGAIWWRAQLRRRNAAIEKMSRPILGAQIFALVITLVIVGAIALWQADTWSSWFSELPSVLHLDALIPSSLPQTGILWIVVPVFATIALVSGIVVYLASEKQ
ncbi:MAG TPA: hypothetical protein VN753_15455 [Terracidiphilus sp.]|nr:hypothetical protein [Terracidiphilus sp.]